MRNVSEVEEVRSSTPIETEIAFSPSQPFYLQAIESENGLFRVELRFFSNRFLLLVSYDKVPEYLLYPEGVDYEKFSIFEPPRGIAVPESVDYVDFPYYFVHATPLSNVIDTRLLRDSYLPFPNTDVEEGSLLLPAYYLLYDAAYTVPPESSRGAIIHSFTELADLVDAHLVGRS